MTTEELNTIVQQVMAQIEDNALDFDVQITSPESNDYLMASRLKSDGTYSGRTLPRWSQTWPSKQRQTQ